MSVDEAVERVREFTELGEGRAYLLMAFARKKYNEDRSSSDERVYRKVITDGESVEFQTRDLFRQMSRHNLHWRVYLTVNGRDVRSAYIGFVKQLIDWSEELIRGHEPAEEKIMRLGSEWRSCLHQPAHKADSLFQIDLDSPDRSDLEMLTRSVERDTAGEVVYTVDTPNGYHIVTKPFNYPEWECAVEYDDLDTDGMVFIEQVDNRNQ